MDDLDQFIDEQLADPEFARSYIGALNASIGYLRSQRRAAADLLDAIGALHQPVSNPYDSEPNSLCGHCLHQWPCKTHRLLHPEGGPS